MNRHPNKPTAAAKFSARAKGGELALRVDCADLPVVPWKPYVQSKEMERALERVANSWKPIVG